VSSFVVDACSIALFQSERVSDEAGRALAAMEYLLSIGVIALDDNDLILQEWLDTCSYANSCQLSLNDWVADLMSSGKIKLVEMKKEQTVRSKVKTLKVPIKDQKYIYTAHSAQASAITTEDVDLHAPSCKGNHKKRIKVMKDKSGPVCRYVKKELGVLICKLEEITDLF
jgi:hypothetical protein